MKYYHVNEGSIVSMPFEFSLEGGLFYDDSRELPGERYYQYCTAMPIGTLLAQAWDPTVVEEVGRAVGEEMLEYGVTILACSWHEHPQKSALRKKLRVLLRGPICIRNDRSSYDRGRAVQLWMWNNDQTFCMQQSGRQPYGIKQRCI